MNITSTNKLPHRDPLDFLELGRRLRAYGVLLEAVEHLDGSNRPGDLHIEEPLQYFLVAFERSLCVPTPLSLFSIYPDRGIHTLRLSPWLDRSGLLARSFPWANRLGRNLYEFKKSFGERRGIAITTGVQHFRYVLLNLHHLNALGCRLPVEVR